ncbi:hypothetical protein LUZ60_010274 [Juncus effusus]|nr:hypothetical protein LUZ60_010274 [Juncus effusus]
MANKGIKGFKSKFLKTFKSFQHIGHHDKQVTVDVNTRDEHEDEFMFEPSPAPTFGRQLIIPPPVEPSSLNPNYRRSIHRSASSTLEQLLGSDDPLKNFEDKCPPNGRNCVVLYTTSLSGIRKTFQDCKKVKALLENLDVVLHERDISMDLGYRDELWNVLGWRAMPPRLFIRGKYIGGAEVTIGLHEQEKLLPLLKCLPKRNGRICEVCGGRCFIMCVECNGSRKLIEGERNSTVTERCPVCNENGLLPCPVCS